MSRRSTEQLWEGEVFPKFEGFYTTHYPYDQRRLMWEESLDDSSWPDLNKPFPFLIGSTVWLESLAIAAIMKEKYHSRVLNQLVGNWYSLASRIVVMTTNNITGQSSSLTENHDFLEEEKTLFEKWKGLFLADLTGFRLVDAIAAENSVYKSVAVKDSHPNIAPRLLELGAERYKFLYQRTLQPNTNKPFIIDISLVGSFLQDKYDFLR